MLELNRLESIVFSRLKAEFSPKIKAKYKDLDFTTQEVKKSNVQGKEKFPNVYVYLMPGTEIGQTLEADVFEGGLFTFQIRVTNNNGQSVVQEIMNEIVRFMKKLRFQMVATPIYENDADTQWSVARFRRAISKDDIL